MGDLVDEEYITIECKKMRLNFFGGCTWRHSWVWLTVPLSPATPYFRPKGQGGGVLIKYFDRSIVI